MKHIQSKFLFYLLTLLCIAAVAASFYRFVVRNDYVVEYEGDCDPSENACFIGTDEETGEAYYYVKVQKYAPELYAECGPDVVGCESASVCLPTDTRCSVTFCSADTLLEDEQCAVMQPMTQS
jgi:hypothetical protein